MYATNYLETAILNLLRGMSITAPATVYMALYFNSPGESGQSGTEVSYTGYARQPVAFSAPAALNGGIGVQNSADITFAQASVSVGTVTHIGVLDSLTGGNMLLYAELTESLVINANEAPVIVAGEAQWWLTGNMSNTYKTKVLNILRSVNCSGFTPFLSLWGGNPEDGGAELSGGGYARVELTFDAPEEQQTGQMKTSNSLRATTNRSTSAWGTWVYTVVMDAAANGNPVFFVQRTAKDIRKGLLVIVESGDLSLVVN